MTELLHVDQLYHRQFFENERAALKLKNQKLSPVRRAARKKTKIARMALFYLP